ncbi:MAG: NADH-quinone oxidoreductase subunit C [Coriobacteriia bacterium]|nr:NADH-quinone oxidoreductase subunit C [Coriobacteriia bacterium]
MDNNDEHSTIEETADIAEAEVTLEPEAEVALEPEAEVALEPEADELLEPEAEVAPEPEADDLTNEEDIASNLQERYNDITVSVQRGRRIWVETPRRRFIELMTYLHDELGFVSLCTVTGLDLGDQFQLIYHLAQDGGIVASVKQNAPRSQPAFDTASQIFKGGVLYELEVRNLLGLNIKGIPSDITYPLPDNWPAKSYPLRKDWKDPNKKEEPKAAKKAATADDTDQEN